MNLQFFGGSGASSGKRKTGGATAIEKLNMLRTAEVNKISEARRIAELKAISDNPVMEAKKAEVKKPFDRNSQVSKFMDRLLAMPEQRWNKNVFKKEGENFESYSKILLNLTRYDTNVKQSLITMFKSAVSGERIEGVINQANRVISDPYIKQEFKDVAKQWKNYLEYHLENRLEDFQRKFYKK